MLFSYLLSVVYLVIILCTLFICTSSPLYTHIHTLIRSFLTTLDLHVHVLDALFLLCRCSRRWYASWRAGASPYLIPVFLSLYIFWFSLYQIHLLFQFLIHMVSWVDAYMYYCSGRWLIIV